MSIRWWAAQDWTPPFTGTKDEALANSLTHKWEREYTTPSLFIVVCSKCGVRKDAESPNYECGSVPNKIDWDTYARIMTALGREKELPIPR